MAITHDRLTGPTLSLYVSDENHGLIERLDRIGLAVDRSRNWLIMDAIEKYVRLRERDLPFRKMRPRFGTYGEAQTCI